MRSRFVMRGVVLLVVAALAYGGYELGRGHRYRLYTSALAGDCWRAVQITTIASSNIEPETVNAPRRAADGRAQVSIDYTMDRVLGGKTLNVRCVFAPDGGSLESVEFDGVALDGEALAEVNRKLGS